MLPKLKSFLKFIGYTSLFITTCVAFIIGMAFYFFYAYSQEVYYKEKFDQKIWHENTTKYHSKENGWIYLSKGGCNRGEMAQDLMANYIKTGMTSVEVIKLLNKPTSLKIYEGFFSDTTCLSYDLGSCELGSGTNILLVCIDENDKVTKTFLSSLNDDGKTKYINK